MINKIRKVLLKKNFDSIDDTFLRIDKSQVLRTNNIQYIPKKKFRSGGKVSYAEWAHVIGIFQTLIFLELEKDEGNKILDIGCGTGLLGIACKNFVKKEGFYLGLDVVKENINFCKKQYRDLKQLKFQHFNVNNGMYAKDQSKVLKHWEVNDNSMDIVTALSVWTHLNEKDAKFYFKEVNRVLRKGGKAIITFFYLDKMYIETINERKNQNGEFHSTNQMSWIFDTSVYGSNEWFCPKYLSVPENAIGVTVEGLKQMLDETDLKMIKYYSGNWKEKLGVYFQDVLIFEKE